MKDNYLGISEEEYSKMNPTEKSLVRNANKLLKKETKEIRKVNRYELKKTWRRKKAQATRVKGLAKKFDVYNSKVSYGKDEYGRLKVNPAESQP